MIHEIERRYFEGHLAGVAVWHDCNGTRQYQWAPIAEHGQPIEFDATTWKLVSLDPLTIEPSLLCTACGDHGFVRHGEWVPA